jgi:hypothetical protein
MKEDHMKNGQLKPAYNAVIGVDSEYIVGAMISQAFPASIVMNGFTESILKLKIIRKSSRTPLDRDCASSSMNTGVTFLS